MLVFNIPLASAHDWSANEYIDKCSVVHQKTIRAEDEEIVGYCMGVLKGAIAGIFVSKSLAIGEFKLTECIISGGKTKFWDIQKDVIATMRVNMRGRDIAHVPNTANAAVVMALIQLYPCLQE